MSNLWEQIVPPIAIALLAGGTSPWWINAIKSRNKTDTAAAEAKPVGTPAVAATPQTSATDACVISTEFFAGRWLVNQDMGFVSGGTTCDYFLDGQFEGVRMRVSGSQGERSRMAGTWTIQKLSDTIFRLNLAMDDGSSWSSKFKVISRNVIQNIDENYIAERVQ